MKKAQALLFALFGALFATTAHADDAANPHARDLLMLSQWFEGEFDNEEQRWFEAGGRSATPDRERHERIHTIHTRLQRPDIGDHVFYVEEYRKHDPADVIRQRLVIISADAKQGIRMQQGFLKNSSRYRADQRNANTLGKLKLKNVTFLDECDVYWRRVADQFEGQMRERACVFGEGEKRRYSVHNLYLSATKYWRVDTTFLTSDNSLHIGHPVDKPFELRRARRFECSVIFKPDPAARGQSVDGLSIHDQGGTIVATRESDGKEFTVLMRNKEYPYYETRPDFIYLSMRETGGKTSLAYSVNDPLSRSLGVSASGVTAYCYLPGYNFQEAYETL